MERGPKLVLLPHFLYNFVEKYLSRYILLIELVSLSGCLYFVRYWTICLLQLFINQVSRHEFQNYPYPSNQVAFST